MSKHHFIDGQIIWYCKLELHEVIYAKNPYDDERAIARFPPENIQCFTDFDYLYSSRMEAINAIIQRIEMIEGTSMSTNRIQNESNQFNNNEREDYLLKLINALDERIRKLEQECNYEMD